jgi:2'-5' RNA ligase
MRLFFALWPPADAAAALARWAQSFDGRAMPVENIHLTLAFLGEADPAKAAIPAGRIHAKPFAFPVDHGGYWRHNKIVWAGPRQMPRELGELAASLQTELVKEGFSLEKRPFAAHVTLVRKAKPVSSLPDLPRVDWPVREFALVQSIHGKYKNLETFQLA